MRVFDEIFVDKTKYGTKIKTDDYQEYGLYPIIDQGQKQIAGYTDLSEGVFTDVPAIIFGDHTRIIKYVDKPFFIGADGVKILKSNLENANYKYLYYALLNAKIPNTGYNRHFKWLKQLKFSCPDLDRQKSIVNILDNIKIVIDFRTKQLEKYDELIKARFVEMFGDFERNSMGWEIQPFSYFASIDGNMTTDFDKYADYPHIGVGNIEKDTGNLIDYKTIREDNVISGKYLFTPEHIIYSKIRPNLNKVALPAFEGLCSADAYPILPKKENCNRIFLAIAMRSDYFLGYILQFSSRTNMPKVNRKEISSFKMPLPPLSLQNDFADFVKLIYKSKFVVQKSLDKAQLLFDSLMQEYFG